MKKTFLIAALLISAGLLPGAVSANVPEGTAKIMTQSVPSSGETWSEDYFSTFSDIDSSDGSGVTSSAQSTLYFRDAYDRLVSFEMTRHNQTMSLVIRQNMTVVWKGSCHVKTNQFGVTRRASMGRNYFEITMGEHVYRAEINSHDRWIVTENGNVVNSQEPVPLTKKEAPKTAPAESKA